jgi:hypothetical protein
MHRQRVDDFVGDDDGEPAGTSVSVGCHKTGSPGDFITAPEISQMFGEFGGFWRRSSDRPIRMAPAARVADAADGRLGASQTHVRPER